MYHYVRDHDIKDAPVTKDLSVPPGVFREHMNKIRLLADAKKITLINGEEFLSEFKKGCFISDNIWIFSADDGWSDMYTNLYPIIDEYKIPFFFGIVSDFLDKKGFISTVELKLMSKNPLVTIASHSIHHSDNGKLNEMEETHEVCDSKKILEGLTGKAVSAYIYPSGRMNEKIDTSVLESCDYTIAWSTGFGREYNTTTGSAFDLNRIRIHGDTKVGFFDEILNKQTKIVQSLH